MGDRWPRSVVNELAVGSQPRAGAGRVLKTRGKAMSQISLRHPARSREWLNVALLECQLCHQVVERRSPVQRHCAGCTAELRRMRSRRAMRRSRKSTDH